MEHKLPFELEKPEILVKREIATDPKLGCKPEERTTDELIQYGVVNINKPVGPTSHQVSAFVQDILHITKAGHSGTLDPHVHGVLPIALQRGTRMVQMLLTAGKEYVGIMHLHDDFTQKQVEACIKKHFLGTINQLPPIKSSVKRVHRDRNIYYFDILEMEEKDALFVVGCQAGTYIRKLIHDLGKKLGAGAHMQELRRTKAGPFTEENICSLQDLADAYHYYKKENNEVPLRKLIMPIERATGHLKKVWIVDGAVDSVAHGAMLNVPGIAKVHDSIKKGDTVAVMTLKDELVSLGTAQLSAKEMVEQQKGLAVQNTKVFMERGVYKETSK